MHTNLQLLSLVLAAIAGCNLRGSVVTARLQQQPALLIKANQEFMLQNNLITSNQIKNNTATTPAATSKSKKPIPSKPLFIPSIVPGPQSKYETLSTSPMLQQRAATSNFVNNPESTALSFAMTQLKMKKNEYIIKDSYMSSSTGITHVRFKQIVQGIEVSNAIISVHVNSQGKVIAYEDNFNKSANPSKNQLWNGQTSVRFTRPRNAFATLAKHVGKLVSEETIIESVAVDENGKTQYILKEIPDVMENVVAKRSYIQGESGNLEACWEFLVNYGGNYFNAHVSADGQNVLAISDWISYASYNVFKLGDTDPSKDKRVMINNPENKIASPEGWHRFDGQATTTTQGNNADAQWAGDDYDDYNRPEAKNLVFDYPLDLNKGPAANKEAAVTNMFYAINSMHDIAFRYGFNEEAGNFQNKNFNKAGKGKAKDAVYAVAQDALGSNGAMFMSKPDGQAPYMSVWTWQTTSPGRDGALVNDLVVHEYTHGISDRLIGGASTPNCLSTQEAKGLSEGWSDFFAAWMQMKASDNHDKITAIASYLGANDRPYSYSIHKERNPLTFGMANLADPMKRYVVGTIWGTMLYQIYWVFVDALKFTDKRETPDATKGNTRVFQLIIDSLAVTPCNPTFIQARDAILQSENNNNSKDSFYCKLWAVFAFRGLGHSAGYDSNGKPIEKFDVHPSCTSKATA